MERFHAAVAGNPVDRIPITVWLHFVTDFVDGAESARLHARFFRQYDWDLAKVISDYRLPLPDGMETFESPQDMARIRPASMAERTYQEQFRLLRVLRADLGEDWPIIDTTFEPLQQITRKVGSAKTKMIFDNPALAKPMLEALTETVIAYVRELKRIGVDGVLYSVFGGIQKPHPKGIDDATFKEFMRPYDQAILAEMEGMVRILHVCQTHLDFDRFDDYPCEALSWWDRHPSCPSLAEMRKRTDKCLVGGMDHEAIIDRSVPDLRAEINDAIDQVDGHRFILGPGCTIRSQVPQHILNCIRTTVNERGMKSAA